MPPQDDEPPRSAAHERRADAPLPDGVLPEKSLPVEMLSDAVLPAAGLSDTVAEDATPAPSPAQRPLAAPRDAWGSFLWFAKGGLVSHFIADETPAVSVPRRFGMGTLLVLITVYAMWFQVGKYFQLHPAVIAGVSLYGFVLGLVQWFVGEGQRVRRASAWTGVVMVWGGCLVVMVADIAQGLRGSLAVTAAPCVFFATFPVGMFLGYAGGTLVAGVFLLMRLADEAIERWRAR